MANNSGPRTATLFPILNQPRGIARMALEAEQTGEGHEVEFRALEVRSLLNKTTSRRRLSMAWSINPYRGCEFACRYCYARYTHQFLDPAPLPSPEQSVAGDEPQAWAVAFERTIYLKRNAAWLLEQDLRAWDRAGRPREEEIAIGTATDPYQPVERSARITRSLLEVFTRRVGHRIGIVTKSRLIERDIDLLQEIARHNTLVVHLTITTADAGLARVLEPRAPRPDLRLRAVRRLRQAGIATGVLCSPLLPGITDSPDAIDRMASRAAEAGASFFAAEPLFLKSCSRPTYLSFVREHYPALVADYEQRFASRDFAATEYRQELAHRVGAACRRYGLAMRSTDALLTRDAGPARKVPLSVAGRSSAQSCLFA